VTVQVTGTPNQTVTGTFTGTIASGATATFVVGNFNASAGGLFFFDVYSDLAADTTFFNDSLSADVNIAISPAAPLAISDSLCATNAAAFLLSASSPGATILWYDSPLGGTLLAEGDTFITPLLSANATYYAQAAVNPVVDPDFTPATNSIGAGAYSTLLTDGMKFNVLQALTLKSVRIYPNGGGNVIVHLRVGGINAPPIQSDTFAIPLGVADTVLVLNWDIPQGSNYVINASGTSLTGATGTNGLYRNSGGALFPYEVPGVISILSSANNSPSLYYFFYDWEIESLNCPSGLIPVQAVFLPPVAVNLGPDGTQCSGFVLDAFDPSITSYVWNNDPAIISPTFTVNQTGIYTVQVTNIDGCTDADTVVLLITPSPSVDLGNDSS
ncbi:MAG: hypothetical protein EAZ89_21390, partial [Bacteroidetes bacterium]